MISEDKSIESVENPVTSGATEEKTENRSIIGINEIKNAQQILKKYKDGKANLEQKIIENEQFWKLRHWQQLRPDKAVPATGWLWNVIVSKHADLEDGYPEPNILPREEGDREEADKLSSIIPVVMDQNEFREVYSECNWYKLKQGCSVYGIFWDGRKLGGLGDIAIRKIDLLNLFWEPGIDDIQRSKHLFHVELADREQLEDEYPNLKDKTGQSFEIAKYIYDDSIDTTDKTVVIDWYYHKNFNGRNTLQYVKFCGDTVLYATENEDIREEGLYRHGMYPFVFDVLYGIEGSPCGYGFTDICKDTQLNIDRLNFAIIDNAMKSSKRRFFIRSDGGVNEEEYADWDKDFVHTSISLGDESVKEIVVSPLDGNMINLLNQQIEMLKNTSGSTDSSNGVAQSGVTAASAIAALQEASGKTSRDMVATTYKAYKKIILFVIELIREFYSVSRQFRITGANGKVEFVSYDNSRLDGAEEYEEYGVSFGGRVPQFDIDVHIQKATTYTKLAQNELALELYGAGVFAPQNADTSLTLLKMMDFKGKDELTGILTQNAGIYDELQRVQSLAMMMAQRYGDREAMAALGMTVSEPFAAPAGGIEPTIPEYNEITGSDGQEHSTVEKARMQTQESTQPR